jgi:hypothetical protein
MMRTLLCSAAFLLAALPTAANALDLYGVDLKIGVRGGPNVSLLNKPGGAEAWNSVAYPTMYGIGWNVGGAINFRALRFLGLEVGYTFSREHVAASYELDDVLDCSAGDGRCDKQRIGLEMAADTTHIPVVLQFILPLGPARPFVSVGLDLVTARRNQSFTAVEEDPWPEHITGDSEYDLDLIDDWENSPAAVNVRNATINPDTENTHLGILAGFGVDIVPGVVELPVEFRLGLYPAAGGTLPERGVFPGPCAEGECDAADPTNPVLYNDVWTTQFLVLFGLDYVIF